MKKNVYSMFVSFMNYIFYLINSVAFNPNTFRLIFRE